MATFLAATLWITVLVLAFVAWAVWRISNPPKCPHCRRPIYRKYFGYYDEKSAWWCDSCGWIK